MPLYLSALFLLASGGGVLPAGTNFFRGRWMPTRKANPFAFHFFLALYFSGGMALSVWGLLCLVGMAPPLPWQ